MEVHGSVLGAHTQGETHWQNDTSLAGRPKDTNPYPGRDPYRGGAASRRLLLLRLLAASGEITPSYWQ